MSDTAIMTAQPAQITPMALIEFAMSKGDMTMVKEFMDLKDRHEATEARKAFVAAMAAFKGETITVIKDKENVQFSKGEKKAMYVSLGNLVATVTPFLSKHGLSMRWDLDQSEGVRVSCIVTHSQGHAESVAMVCPPDKSGSKNPIQEIKSAITYAKACTFESICGLASTDANVEDDGNRSAARAGISEQRIVECVDWIEAANTLPELQRVWADAMLEAKTAKDQKAQAAYIEAKNKRKGQLAKVGA